MPGFEIAGWLEATPPAGVSADVKLNALTASTAAGADRSYVVLTLTRADTTGHIATVVDVTTPVKRAPVAAHAAATVTVNGAAVASGSLNVALVPAGSGETVIAARVTAEDGTTVTSAIPGDPGFEVSLDAVRREAGNDNGTVERGAKLHALVRRQASQRVPRQPREMAKCVLSDTETSGEEREGSGRGL